MDFSQILNYIPYGREGGWIMPFIYLFAVLATAVFLERLWFLKKKNVVPDDLMERLRPLLSEKKWDSVLEFLKPGKSSLERIAYVIISNRDKPIDLLKDLVEDAGRREREILEKGMGVVSLTVSISPLLGLLGTVSGMIKVFNAISRQAIGNPERLAGGISEALLTTFAGLTVAIIALIMWNFLNARVKKFTRDLEDYAVEIITEINSEEQ
jgi:biopolymer transport protein ExbB